MDGATEALELTNECGECRAGESLKAVQERR